MLRAIPFLIIALLLSCTGVPAEKLHRQSLLRKHEVIAVLPFEIEFNIPKHEMKYSSSEYESLTDRAGYQMQEVLFRELANEINKGKFEKKLQRFDVTADLLVKNDYHQPYQKLHDLRVLGKKLGVDALFLGHIEVEKGFVAWDSGQGVAIQDLGVELILKLIDVKSGQLMWQTRNTKVVINRELPWRLSELAVLDAVKENPYRRL